MGHGGQGGDVGHIAQRVADRLAIHGLGAGIDQLGKRGWVFGIGKAHLDAHLREGVGKQVVGASVQRGGRHDVVARLGNGLDRVRNGSHAGGHRQRTNAAFHGGHARFQHAIGGVHDAAVNVASHLQVKQVGPMLRIVKGVGHCLVDRHGHSLGGGVRRIAAMHGQSFQFHERVSCSWGETGRLSDSLHTASRLDRLL